MVSSSEQYWEFVETTFVPTHSCGHRLTPEKLSPKRVYKGAVVEEAMDLLKHPYNPGRFANNILSGLKTFQEGTGLRMPPKAMWQLSADLQGISLASLILQYALLPSVIASQGRS